MRIGDMRSRVSLEYDAGGVDRLRGASEDWQELAMLWAMVEPLGSEERTLAAQRGLYASYKATLRYPSIKPYLFVAGKKRLRIILEDTTYNVEGVTISADKKSVTLLLRESP